MFLCVCLFTKDLQVHYIFRPTMLRSRPCRLPPEPPPNWCSVRCVLVSQGLVCMCLHTTVCVCVSTTRMKSIRNDLQLRHTLTQYRLPQTVYLSAWSASAWWRPRWGLCVGALMTHPPLSSQIKDSCRH